MILVISFFKVNAMKLDRIKGRRVGVESWIIHYHLLPVLENQHEEYSRIAFNLTIHQQIFIEGLLNTRDRVRKVNKIIKYSLFIEFTSLRKVPHRDQGTIIY